MLATTTGTAIEKIARTMAQSRGWDDGQTPQPDAHLTGDEAELLFGKKGRSYLPMTVAAAEKLLESLPD